jgi:hypothetical protein
MAPWKRFVFLNFFWNFEVGALLLMQGTHTQYKTVGVQWFARGWRPLQLFPTVDRNALRKPNRFILSNVMGYYKCDTRQSE